MIKKIHVIIVEDEAIIAMDTKECLEELGYVVDCMCANTKEALEYVDIYRPDIVLLDIILQEGDEGTTIAPVIQKEYGIPVIYVTAHSDSQTLEKAGETLPYGYIVKPIDDKQLHSTITMALSKRKQELQSPKKPKIREIVSLSSNYSYDTNKKELIYNGDYVDLTKRERQLFDIFVLTVNSTVTYKSIELAVWGDRPTTQATLRSLVRRLRDKLEEEVIENVTSVGYRVRTDRVEEVVD